jgi:hypothetical protein
VAADSRRHELIGRQRLSCVDNVHEVVEVERQGHGTAQRDMLLVHATDDGVGHVERQRKQERFGKDVAADASRDVLRLEQLLASRLLAIAAVITM